MLPSKIFVKAFAPDSSTPKAAAPPKPESKPVKEPSPPSV